MAIMVAIILLERICLRFNGANALSFLTYLTTLQRKMSFFSQHEENAAKQAHLWGHPIEVAINGVLGMDASRQHGP